MKKGLTLIELMVAIILTGIVTWMTLNLFANENQAYTRTRERVRLQADSREALRLIEQEVRNLGYKTTVAISANRIRSSIGTCSDTWINTAGGDTSSFGFKNATDLSGDSVAFLFHEVQTGPLSGCTNLRTIGFRKSGSQLQRRWCGGVCTTEPWIPLLDSVVSFQIRYGLIANPSDTSTQNGPAQLQTSTRWTGGALTKAGTAPTLTLGGWATTRQTAIYGFPIDSLSPKQTWEISFTSTPNDALVADMDSASFKAGFYNADGSVSASGDTASFLPGMNAGVARTVTIRLAPSSTSVGGRYFAIEGRRKTSTQAGWSLAISGLSIRRIARGQYRWVESPTAAEKNKVRALDIHLLVKARKTSEASSLSSYDSTALGQTGLTYTPSGADLNRSFILFQRLVPVVNNGI